MISVLLATHNGEKYLKYSIESILNQTFKEIEILVGFNVTTDNSKSIIKSYNDNRIRIFDYDEKGKAKTLNKLIKETKFEWLAMQDDDDIWMPNKLEKQINYINEYDVIGTFCNYIGATGNMVGSSKIKSLHDDIIPLSLGGDNQMVNSSTIFKKKDILEIGGWQEDLDGIEDFDVWLKLMRKSKKFINVPEPLILHRLHAQSNFNTKQWDLQKILKNE
jgi:glycosyltransferase involved in cell wall biosynthesis